MAKVILFFLDNVQIETNFYFFRIVNFDDIRTLKLKEAYNSHQLLLLRNKPKLTFINLPGKEKKDQYVFFGKYSLRRF